MKLLELSSPDLMLFEARDAFAISQNRANQIANFLKFRPVSKTKHSKNLSFDEQRMGFVKREKLLHGKDLNTKGRKVYRRMITAAAKAMGFKPKSTDKEEAYEESLEYLKKKNAVSKRGDLRAEGTRIFKKKDIESKKPSAPPGIESKPEEPEDIEPEEDFESGIDYIDELKGEAKEINAMAFGDERNKRIEEFSKKVDEISGPGKDKISGPGKASAKRASDAISNLEGWIEQERGRTPAEDEEDVGGGGYDELTDPSKAEIEDPDSDLDDQVDAGAISGSTPASTPSAGDQQDPGDENVPQAAPPPPGMPVAAPEPTAPPPGVSTPASAAASSSSGSDGVGDAVNPDAAGSVTPLKGPITDEERERTSELLKGLTIPQLLGMVSLFTQSQTFENWHTIVNLAQNAANPERAKYQRQYDTLIGRIKGDPQGSVLEPKFSFNTSKGTKTREVKIQLVNEPIPESLLREAEEVYAASLIDILNELLSKSPPSNFSIDTFELELGSNLAKAKEEFDITSMVKMLKKYVEAEASAEADEGAIEGEEVEAAAAAAAPAAPAEPAATPAEPAPKISGKYSLTPEELDFLGMDIKSKNEKINDQIDFISSFVEKLPNRKKKNSTIVDDTYALVVAHKKVLNGYKEDNPQQTINNLLALKTANENMYEPAINLPVSKKIQNMLENRIKAMMSPILSLLNLERSKVQALEEDLDLMDLIDAEMLLESMTLGK